MPDSANVIFLSAGAFLRHTMAHALSLGFIRLPWSFAAFCFEPSEASLSTPLEAVREFPAEVWCCPLRLLEPGQADILNPRPTRDARPNTDDLTSVMLRR